MSASTEAINTKTFEEILESRGKLIFKNKGISMLPFIRQDRDIIIIKRKEKDIRCKRLDVVLFKRSEGQYILHRILKVGPDGYWIVGDNCTYGEWVMENQVLGILTQVIRNSHSITDNNFLYRIYVHLWCAPLRIRFGILRIKVLTMHRLKGIYHRFIKVT